MTERRNFHRERWMRNFETLVVEARPDLAGKIEWQSAEHFYNQALVSDEAAAKYIRNRPLTA